MLISLWPCPGDMLRKLILATKTKLCIHLSYFFCKLYSHRLTPLLYALKQDKIQERNSILQYIAFMIFFSSPIYKERCRAHINQIKYTNKKLWAGTAHPYLKYVLGKTNNKTQQIKLSSNYTGNIIFIDSGWGDI